MASTVPFTVEVELDGELATLESEGAYYCMFCDDEGNCEYTPDTPPW